MIHATRYDQVIYGMCVWWAVFTGLDTVASCTVSFSTSMETNKTYAVECEGLFLTMQQQQQKKNKSDPQDR